jgi:hypothetical protein
MSWADERLERCRGFLSEEAPGERTFGRYRLLEPLGEGGSGVVFRARDEELGRDVALKMLKAVQALSPVELERFRREGRNAARLRHPAIVTVFDVGREGDVFYYTMEVVPGRPFRPGGDRARDLGVLEKVAWAMQHAHEQGILHRDLKPGNILVDERGEPHLLDFGLSRDVAAPSEITRQGSVFGTPGYMAPEQAGSGAADARSDVYALGAMLYEILAGRPPVVGSTFEESVARLRSEEPAPPPGPPELAAVAMKALEREPARRYATAAAFARELERFRAGKPVEARPRRGASPLLARLFLAGAAGLVALWALTGGPGPVGHWTLEEAGELQSDASGNGFPGAARGGPERVPGPRGGALRFDGVDDRVELPGAPALDRLQEGSYTIAAWFRPEGLPSTEGGAIVMKPGFHEGIRYLGDGGFVMEHWLADGRCVAAGTWQERFPPGPVYHVAGVVDRQAGRVEIFVDGRRAGTASMPPGAASLPPGPAPWRIGMANPPGSRFACPARGLIDDVRLYARALGESEIRALAAR